LCASGTAGKDIEDSSGGSIEDQEARMARLAVACCASASVAATVVAVLSAGVICAGGVPFIKKVTPRAPTKTINAETG